MRQTRRRFLTATAATAGGVTVLPYAHRVAAQESDVFETPAGPITIHPVSHASFVMETPLGVIYVDPVGGPEAYADFPEPDLVLVTHEHGDHYNVETLAGVATTTTEMITNPAVYDMLPEALAARSGALSNGEETVWNALPIRAIPAYNTTAGRLNYHPEGRDNGYVLDFDGFRVYVSGDTEDIPEMRALEGIDLAFLCMNLPFTMDAAQAASAVEAFRPGVVYPYHYRGRDGGTQDPEEFAALVGEAAEVRFAPWYG